MDKLINNRYISEKRIGNGTYGIIYLVIDTKDSNKKYFWFNFRETSLDY